MGLVTTRRDLTDLEARKDCARELERAELAGDDLRLLAWARTWGGALRAFLLDAEALMAKAGDDENGDWDEA